MPTQEIVPAIGPSIKENLQKFSWKEYLILAAPSKGEKVNTNSIFRITKFMTLGLFAFLTACSPLVVIQPTSEAPSPTALPTIAINSTLVPTSLPTIKPTASQHSRQSQHPRLL